MRRLNPAILWPRTRIRFVPVFIRHTFVQTSAFRYLFDSWGIVRQSGCICQHTLCTVLSRSTSCKFVFRSVWTVSVSQGFVTIKVVSHQAFKVMSPSVPVPFWVWFRSGTASSDSLIVRRCWLPIKSTVCSFVSQPELSSVPVRHQCSRPSSRFRSVVGSSQSQVLVNY